MTTTLHKSFLLILASLLLAGTVEAVYTDAHPVAFYRFDSNSTADSYGYGANFTVSGATGTTTHCNAGGCYQFDGTNDELVLNATNVNPLTNAGISSGFTVCAYTYKDGTSQKGWLDIGGARTANSYNTTDLQYMGGTGYGDHCSGWSNAGAYAAGAKKFFCVKASGTTLLTSINGAAFGGSTSILFGFSFTAPPTNWKTYLELGVFRANTPTGDFWDGTVDDLMLFNYTLTDAQVAAVYANTSGVSTCPFTTCVGASTCDCPTTSADAYWGGCTIASSCVFPNGQNLYVNGTTTINAGIRITNCSKIYQNYTNSMFRVNGIVKCP
jgi:hypothetical protein